MDSETWLYSGLVLGGLILILAVMIFFVNPPEAWIKRAMARLSARERNSSNTPKR